MSCQTLFSNASTAMGNPFGGGLAEGCIIGNF